MRLIYLYQKINVNFEIDHYSFLVVFWNKQAGDVTVPFENRVGLWCHIREGLYYTLHSMWILQPHPGTLH